MADVGDVVTPTLSTPKLMCDNDNKNHDYDDDDDDKLKRLNTKNTVAAGRDSLTTATKRMSDLRQVSYR